MSGTISTAGTGAAEPSDSAPQPAPSVSPVTPDSPRPRGRRVVVAGVPAPVAPDLPSSLVEQAVTEWGSPARPPTDETAASVASAPPLSISAPQRASLIQPIQAEQGVIGGFLAAGIAGAGEALLFPEATRPVGAAVLAGALVLAALAWRDLPDAPLLSVRPQGLRGLIAWQGGLLVRLVGIGGAVGLAVEGILAWLLHPDDLFGLQGVLWLASMGLLLLSCARWYPSTQTEADLGPPWTRAEVLAFGGIVALSFFTHLAWLYEIPWRFHFDETIAYTESMRFYRGPLISLFTTTWFETSLPSLWFSFAAGLLRLAGPGLVGVRLGVALIGALTVIPVYGLARLAWGRTAALVAAFAVATSATYIHYSRVSIINITTPFWWAVCFYFLLRGLRSRRPGDFVWAGLAAGTSMYTYYGTRLLPYLLLAFFGYLILFHFRAARERLGHFALVGVGFFVGFGPLIGYFLRNPDMWAGRGLSTLNVPPVIPTTWDALVRDWNILAPLAAQNFLALSVVPGRDTVWYAPFFLPPLAVLLLVGAGVLIARWRQPAAFLTLLWGLSVILTGGTLLDWTTIPNFAHWAPAFPALFLALAVPVALWLGALRRSYPRRWVAGCAVVAVALVTLAVADNYAYLATYPARVPPDKSLEAVQGRYLASLPPQTVVRIVGQSWQLVYPDAAAMMAPAVPAANFYNPSRALPVIGDPDHDLAFLFYDQRDYLSVVQEYYPGGEVRELQTPDGNSVALAYQVPARLAMARYGVALQISGGPDGRTRWQGQVPAVGALPAGVTFSYPLTATWSGLLYSRSGSPIRLRLEGSPAHPAVSILNSDYGFGVPRQFDFGWTPVSVTAQLNNSGPLRLTWQEGDAAPAEVPTARLWPSQPGAGLAVALNGAQVQRRVDPFIGSGVWRPPPGSYVPGNLAPADAAAWLENVPLAPLGGGGNLMRWEGEVFSEQGGTYVMEIAAGGRARVVVNDIRIINICDPTSGTVGAVGSIRLNPGWNPIQVTYQAQDGGIALLWTRPDGVREIVPPSRLRHTVDPGGAQPWPAIPAPISCADPP